jgi:sensor domain CHASE-containing protein/two-component sensor histidine kinase
MVVQLSLKLRRKTLAILLLTMVSLIIVQHCAAQFIFLNSFETLEQQDTIQNVHRAHSALIAELNNLDTFVYDWAAWDDTYAFIQDANEDYIESNLVDETFIGSELNIALYVNSAGEIVFGKAFDLETEQETLIPESITEHLQPNKGLLNHPDTENTVKGVIRLPEGLMLIISSPIIQSNEEGPILGSLIMGYYYDVARLETLADTTHLSLTMQQINGQEIPTEYQEVISVLSDEKTTVVTPITSNSIAGYTLIEDIYGEPAMVLRVELPRTIYQQGRMSVSYFLLLIVTTGITFSIVITRFLEKTVLSRLAHLNAKVKQVRHKGNPSERVSVSGKDEISDLADEINKMLTTLEQSQNKLEMLNEKLGVVGSLTRHDVRNKLAIIANNLYLAKKKLEGNSDILENFDAINVAIDKVDKIFEFAKTYEKVGAEELTYIDVKQIIQEAIMIQELNDINLVNECDGLTVLADSLLRQLFFNLIENTVKYGEKVSQIRVYYKNKEDELQLIYEDNGVGIPETEKELIFKEGNGKGTGYGLYLIRKICQAYGWTIKETGKQGEGARFVMILPKTNKNKEKNYEIK